MGQTLSEPIREKHSESGGDSRHLYGASEMQGWRINMEDAHTMLLELEGGPNAFFAVYDGHGGSSTAKFAGENVHKRLANEETYKAKDYKAALKRAYLGTDEDLRSDSNFFRDPSGCTAVSALITADDKIIVANAGDSRCVMSVKGEAKPLSFDHKPQNEGESSRIKAAGGFVEYGRVNGNLALSRAIGDFEFKGNTGLEPEKQIVTSDPEITEHDPTEEDEFVVIACDGIWDCLTSQQVVDMTRRLIADKKELPEICEIVMDKCLAPDSDINGGVGCDNMTAIVIALLRGRTKEQWYDWIADRVENKIGYETPKELPKIYAEPRLQAATQRWTSPANRFGGGNLHRPGGSGFGSLARVFGSNVMFHPPSGISNNLAFENDDSSDEYESEEGEHDASGNGNYYGSLRAPLSKDVNKSLRDQLEELKTDGEKDQSTRNKKWTIDGDGDANMAENETSSGGSSLAKSVLFSRRSGKKQPSNDGSSADAEGEDDEEEVESRSIPVGLASAPPKSIGAPLIASPNSISTTPRSSKSPELQGEAPTPPKVNGITKSPVRVKQLEKSPSGDELSGAAKVEGLLDKGEDPLLMRAD